jgi:uncharacterized protein (DUF305 family)
VSSGAFSSAICVPLQFRNPACTSQKNLSKAEQSWSASIAGREENVTAALSPRRTRWRAALITGVVSGTFSTILITVGAPRIGRGRALDWMEIGTVLLGAGSIASDPAWTNIAAGIVVHQSADLFWALLFFGLAGHWTAERSPGALLGLGIPWALGTSAIEYYLLLPWLQPLVPMQVPYWTALGVHVTSALAYPVFPWLLGRVSVSGERGPAFAFQARQHIGTAKAWAISLVAVAALFLILEVSVGAGWEPRIDPGTRSETFDRAFMRQMRAHHLVGVELAELAVDRSARIRVQELGRLMIANQNAEIETLDGWWLRWFGGQVPPVPHSEHLHIPGMPSEAAMRRLEQSRGAEFERLFFPIMIEHHRGAVLMADRAWEDAGDVRLRIYAESLRPAQRGQIRRMAELEKERK